VDEHDPDDQQFLPPEPDPDDVRGMDACWEQICSAERRLLSFIARVDAEGPWGDGATDPDWEDDGARDLSHWLVMRYGISSWKAERWVKAARALESLPRLAEALSSGELGIDKVVELARFARPETEKDLISWATTVSAGRIRHRAELERKVAEDEVRTVESDRRLRWWHSEDGRQVELEARLPAASGAVVVNALKARAQTVPVMPDEQGSAYEERRLADALVELCSERISGDPDPDRATVLVHVRAEALTGDGAGETEGGGIVPSETVKRLLCTSRVQTILEDARGDAIGLGRTSRVPTAAMVRHLRYRDAECRFPGCGSRRFTHAHHVIWWERGGRTDLSNLVLVCGFHHRLVHEHGWGLKKDPDGNVRWFRPDGSLYRAGPGPPREASA
jgi:hypothetical protein